MSATATLDDPQLTTPAEHFDVIVVGAGISGVGAAYHLQEQCPERSYVVLEAMDDFGGTWRCHTYPGIRSDSDLYTFGYRFKPWTGAPIASRDEILKYLNEVIEEHDLGRRIRYHRRITSATWSSEENRWTLVATDTSTDEVHRFTTNFLWMCQGYYRHAAGHTPAWPGMDEFGGPIVHPQTWPEDLDYAGKDVIVVGSGATAATLVPAMAGTAKDITVLRRSPTYFWTGANSNELADTLRELDVDETWIHEIVRRKIPHDEIDRFTEHGIRLKSGREVTGDIVVTATGFDLSVLGDIRFSVDGEPLAFHETATYRGMMFTGIPNMVWVLGYFRASWTLRADLIADLTCRLLHHMDELGARQVTPQLRPEDADMPLLGWIDPENFNPNYLMRSLHLLSRRGDKPEWMHTQDYWTEKDALPAADLDDGCLRYE